MNAVMRTSWVVSMAWLIGWSTATADDELPHRTKSAALDESNRSVELFAAAESGDLEVRYIPRDASEGTVLITNRGGATLNVALPTTFAAVPVLGQFQFPTIGNNTQSQNQQQQQRPQPVGGPFDRVNSRGGGSNGGSNGGGSSVFGSNFFAIPDGQVAELRVTTACLEHGAPTPRAQMQYKLVPLATVSDDPAVETILLGLGEDSDYTQKQVQAAVWNVVNDRSWDELATEKGKMIAAGKNRPYFKKSDLDQARKLVEKAEKARDAQPTKVETAKKL